MKGNSPMLGFLASFHDLTTLGADDVYYAIAAATAVVLLRRRIGGWVVRFFREDIAREQSHADREAMEAQEKTIAALSVRLEAVEREVVTLKTKERVDGSKIRTLEEQRDTLVSEREVLATTLAEEREKWRIERETMKREMRDLRKRVRELEEALEQLPRRKADVSVS